MPDIVERLRIRAATIPAQGDCLESMAADEIERLWAALREIEQRAAKDSPWYAEIARAALAQRS
jgi:hypothetical protein